MNNATSRHIALGALSAAALVFAAAGAQAHAHLVKSDPVADASVAAPQQIHLQFSETLEPKFSGADLMKLDGATLPTASVVNDKNRKMIDATPKAPLAPGGYMVMWHAVSTDGHKTAGSFNFTVR